MTRSRQLSSLQVGVLAFLAAIFLVWAGEDMVTRACLRNDPVKTSATVLSKHEQRGKSGPSYYVVFWFTDLTGQNVEGRGDIGYSQFRRLQVDGPVDVHYCAWNSSRHIVSFDHLSRRIDWHLIAGLFMLLAAGVQFYLQARRRRAQDNSYRFG